MSQFVDFFFFFFCTQKNEAFTNASAERKKKKRGGGLGERVGERERKRAGETECKIKADIERRPLGPGEHIQNIPPNSKFTKPNILRNGSNERLNHRVKD